MQSRGFFVARRSTDETTRASSTVHRSNGDVIRNDYRLPSRLGEGHNDPEENRYRYGRIARDHRDRSVYPKYPYQETSTEANHAARETEPLPRRARHRDHVERSTWGDWPSDFTGSKPILRNGISHARVERLYSSTLPRRSRTINFRDPTGDSVEPRRCYPKSLQDLSDLEADDAIRGIGVTSFLSPGNRAWRDNRLDDGNRRRRYREEQLEDDYLRLYRSLSRLDKYPQGGRYEPGQVHYERECRTFGKDTVAFIYYKTCYL